MLLIVGWDGASPNLVEPMIRKGRLPNLAALRARGVWGRVRAPWPPVTFPSWTTFMTGVNPGRHGIFDFTCRERGTYQVRFVNSTWRRAPTIWSILSGVGRRVCVLGLPATYPPEAVNGIMLSGFDTPVTTWADDSFVYPRERAAEIASLGGFPFADFQEFRVNSKWYARARQRLLRGIEQKLRVAAHFLKQEAWDCFLVLFGESDTVAHHFWHFSDPHSPFAPESADPLMGNVIEEVYQALDEALARLMKLAPDADVLVVSDHGFGGVGLRRIHLNRWLQEHGWLRFLASRSCLVPAWMKPLALSVMPPRFQRILFNGYGGRWSSALETAARFRGIDFARSAAFSEELGYFPSLWLNVKGRDPLGVVSQSDYTRVRSEIRDALLAWRHEDSGRPVVRSVWFREEVYTGPYVVDAPDLLLEVCEDEAGYAVVPASSGGRAGPVVTTIDLSSWRGGKLQGLSGAHCRNGIFALGGPSVVTVGNAGTVDMVQFAPAVLQLCGVSSTPQFFDGETFASIVSTSSLAAASNVCGAIRSPRAYSKEEEVEISKRLEDLGYL
ncbi:MAG: alkaline phosphatase family protein [Candidatus Binatia bacterium]|nr:alkaline phosphatase family protein [Candidatus Binatia bacterium]